MNPFPLIMSRLVQTFISLTTIHDPMDQCDVLFVIHAYVSKI